MAPRTPESLIAHLRNRRRWITIYAFGTGFGLLLVLLSGWRVFAMMKYLAPSSIETIESDLMMMQSLQPMIAMAMIKTVLFSLMTTWSICALCGERFGYPKDRLLVEMWDRIQSLERQLEPPSSPDASSVRDGPAI